MMTIDLDPFKEFLSSLSRVSQLSFEVWDGEGLVFALGADPSEGPNLRAHRDFSAEVMGQAAYQCSQYESQYRMFGIPIKYGQEAIGSLIAYGLNPTGSGNQEISHPKKHPMPKRWRHFSPN